MKIGNASTKDFNVYTAAGTYSIGNITEYSNAPETSTNMSWGNLLVIRGSNSDTIRQIYYNYSKLAHAERFGSGIGTASPSWSTWYNVQEEGIYQYGPGYIKFDDGTQICYTTYSTGAMNNWYSWGSMYAADITDLGYYPIAFYSTPLVFRDIFSGWGGWLILESDHVPSASKWGGLSIIRPTQGDGAVYNISLLAIGRWKA